MPRGSNGIYTKPVGTTALTGTTIYATPYNTLMDDIANALTGSLASDGSKDFFADISAGGWSLTDLRAAVANGEAVRYEQCVGVLNAPSGTAVVFVQTAAPTGWTKITTTNDAALRMVSGTITPTGGSTGFTSVFASRTIAAGNLPASGLSFSDTSSGVSVGHTHSFTAVRGTSNNVNGTGNQQDNPDGASSGTTGGQSADHTHTVSGTTGNMGSGTAMDFAVKYIDVIHATKDAN